MGVRKIIGNRLGNTAPGRYIVHGSKRIFLPGFHGLSVYEVLPLFLQQLRKTSIRERAGGISFNIVMAIPPTLIFLFTLIPYMPISEAFIRQLFFLIRDVIPGEKNNSAIIHFLDDFLRRPRNELLSFGLIVAIFFSSNAMMGVLRAFDKKYFGFLQRSNWQRRKVALKLTMICFLLIFICILMLMAQASVLKYLGVENASLRAVIHNLRWVIVTLICFYIVSFIYRHGPSVTKKWPLITPGSVLTTALMIIATALVSYWVNHFGGYNKLYGSISAIFILMSLIFVNSLALLMGFELNVTLSNLQEKQHTTIIESAV